MHHTNGAAAPISVGLWAVHGWTLLIAIVIVGPALVLPFIGIALLIAAVSYLLPATLAVLTATALHRQALPWRQQATIWAAVFLLSGLIYAVLSAALGSVVGQPGFELVPLAWVMTAPFLIAELATVWILTLRLQRRRLQQLDAVTALAGLPVDPL